MADRAVKCTRKTSETDISLELNLDGSGNSKINTGIGFFDHMTVKGDLYVDCHHTIEDTGIVLGKAIKGALGDKKSIKRFGNFFLPMDETLVMCAIDLSGRPYLVYDLNLSTERVGYFDTQMVKEFFYAVSYAAEMNINLKQFSGENDHHIIEAAFKAFAKALDEATSIDERLKGKLLSTKGSL